MLRFGVVAGTYNIETRSTIRGSFFTGVNTYDNRLVWIAICSVFHVSFKSIIGLTQLIQQFTVMGYDTNQRLMNSRD